MKFIYLNKSYNWDELIQLNSKKLWLKDIQLFLINWFDDDAHIEVYTSGSTGNPKPIKLLKSNIKISAKITNHYFNLSENKIAHLCLPAKYIAGKLMIIRSLESNMDLLIEEPSAYALQSLANPIDFTAMTPLQVNNLLNTDSNKFNLINTIIIGGGAVSKSLFDKLQNIPCDCYQTYGMTETITHIAVQKLNGFDKSDYFKVLNGFEINTDDRGCLTISASHIYEHHVITNDLVKIIDPKSFQWLGRYDNVINSGGVKLYPEVIESKIQSLIPESFFIIGKDDDQLGQSVTLCIEKNPNTSINPDDMLNQIRPRLSKFEIPRSILFFDCFLYTETGKIRRRATLESHR